MANGKCKCGVEFTLENSTATVFKRKRGFCRTCDEVYQQEYYKKNTLLIKTKTTFWAKQNPEQRRKISRKWARINNSEWFRLKAYGITPEEFDDKFEKQKGLCAVCKQPMVGKKRPCLDHNHTTGENRDLLCGSCNCLLGYSYENKEILLSAIKYLEKHASDSSTQIAHVDSSEQDSVLPKVFSIRTNIVC